MQREFDKHLPIYVHSVPKTTINELGFMLSLLFGRTDVRDDRIPKGSIFAPLDSVVNYQIIHERGDYQQNIIVICSNALTLNHPNVINFADLKGQKVEYTF